jgi:hypothetical protein
MRVPLFAAPARSAEISIDQLARFADARATGADDRYSSLARLRNVENWGVPKIRALHEATKFAGLRNAGMPE